MLIWIIIYIYLGAFLVHIFIQFFLKVFTPLCKEFFQILPPFLPVQICVLPYHLFYLPLSFSLGISHFTIWSFIFWYSFLSLFYLLLCLFRNQHSIRSSSFPIPLMISLLSHYFPLTSYLLAYLSAPPSLCRPLSDFHDQITHIFVFSSLLLLHPSILAMVHFTFLVSEVYI